jgi:thymidylate synthase
MALPPCHAMFQMYVSNNKLSCQMYQRSGDAYLGIPFNIASYALLTHMIAQVCNLEVGELILVFGDVHIYKNHIDQVNEILTREPMKLPKLWLNPEIKDINKFTMDDIKLIDYKSHPALKAPMAV